MVFIIKPEDAVLKRNLANFFKIRSCSKRVRLKEILSNYEGYVETQSSYFKIMFNVILRFSVI